MSSLVAPYIAYPALRPVGLPILNTPASPAAGAHFTPTMPGGNVFQLISVVCRLVTDATVANREVVVEYRDAGGNRFYVTGAPVTVAASTTTDYCFSMFQGQADWPADSTILVPLAPIPLVPTYDFRIYVPNVQATDQLSRIRFVWQEYSGDFPVPGRDADGA